MNKVAGEKVAETPLMKQYYSIKSKYPDAILLFRVGDFYETFDEDAIKTSKILGIVLTKRANGAASYVDLAGFPHHALDTYLPKLVRAGYRVAICDQLEDPKLAKTVVKRGVTEIVTPGITFNDKLLDHRSNNYLCSLHIDFSNRFGISFLDISTGEFVVYEGTYEQIDKLIQSYKPSEILVQKDKKKQFYELFGEKFNVFFLDDWVYQLEFAEEKLLKQLNVASLRGFGIDHFKLGIIAAGSILHYLAATEHTQLKHISSIRRIEEERYVWLDKFTIRNLELFTSIHEGAKTFIEVIDRTTTPMGARQMKKWVANPLKDKVLIDERLDVVDFLVKNDELRSFLHNQLKQIGDIERLISKIAVGRVNPREIINLKKALQSIGEIKKQCETINNKNIQRIAEQLNPCNYIISKIENEIHPDAPIVINKGNVIKEGICKELDELRKLAYNSKDYLLQIQQKEAERTGIPSLKIAFNNVFGYYLEVRNTHKDKVPPEWIRKQTLVGCERYITEELKQYEEKILGAEEKILQLETKIFNDLVLAITEFITPIQLNAQQIATIDCLLSFAEISINNNYCKPEINETFVIDIKQGRHPVIETQMPEGEKYVANDLYLDNEKQQIIILTGPNMSGKSALLRQTGLIVLMAQIGCFVPAESAKIGIVDKIFTRVGASDNISLGESTFMVEMIETAGIINNLSERSLVLLDEIGRGTSTYDGISIAWAIAEYLHEHPMYKPKTLFATHYHELNELANSYKRIKNYNIAVKEAGNKIIFLRKLIPGGSEHSFGIHVAEMAGLPKSIIKRANEILQKLENNDNSSKLSKPIKNLGPTREGYQLSIFQLNDPLIEQIKNYLNETDINTLTPIEALIKLNEIKKWVTGA